MANDNKVLTGAIALVKVEGKVVGKMRNIRAQETVRRIPAIGIGTILMSEKPVVGWEGSLTCDFIQVNMKKSGIPKAINRNFSNIESQVLNGLASFEDQLVLDTEGVQLDIFKKVSDAIDENGIIRPKAIPIAVIGNCLIESDTLEISEGSLAGRNQTFSYLKPMIEP